MKKVVIAGMLGNGLEWYDYALYGHMAFIISKLFFPAADDTVNLLATFGVFAVGFVFRPLGAMLFGYIGDRYGRRVSLVIAILMMAIPTGCIGILPTYEQIGILAPILLTLIRVFQGLSLGGEFSGSIAYIVEHAPPEKRGIAGSASIASLIIGFLLGSFVSMTFSWLLPPEDFESWGWRIPFLIGIAIGLVGLYIRSHCDESPAYQKAREEGHLSETPLREAVTHHLPEMFQAFAIYMTVTMPFYLLSIYLITFTEKELGRTATEALAINAVAMITLLLTNQLGACLSDRIGRKKVLMGAAAALLVAIVPLFILMGSTDFASILLAQVAFAFILGVYLGPVPAVLVELFPTSVRYTGMAISYNAAAALFGGTAPMVCVWLISHTGTFYAIPAYVMLCCTISLVTLLFYKERFRLPLQDCR